MFSEFVVAPATATEQSWSHRGHCAHCSSQQSATGAVQAGRLSESMEHHLAVTIGVEFIPETYGEVPHVLVCATPLVYDKRRQVGPIINRSPTEARLPHQVPD